MKWCHATPQALRQAATYKLPTQRDLQSSPSQFIPCTLFVWHVFDNWWISSSKYSSPPWLPIPPPLMRLSSSYSRELRLSSALGKFSVTGSRRQDRQKFHFLLPVLLFFLNPTLELFFFFFFKRSLGPQLIFVIYSLVIFPSFVPAETNLIKKNSDEKTEFPFVCFSKVYIVVYILLYIVAITPFFYPLVCLVSTSMGSCRMISNDTLLSCVAFCCCRVFTWRI